MKKEKDLIMMIGVSGSGKSTYLKNGILKDLPNLINVLEINDIKLEDIIVCPDNIREDVTGSISNMSKDRYVWVLAEEFLNKRIKEYGYAILDATNVNGKYRRKFLKKFKNVKKTAIVFESNPELSKFRINEDIKNEVNRSNVPEFVIDKQHENYKLSVLDNKEFDNFSDAKKTITDLLKKEFSTVVLVKIDK